MPLKDNLTNEYISKNFDNQFHLVTHAIQIVGEMIHSGRGPRVKTDIENPAMQVLEEILEGKDRFDLEAAPAEDASVKKNFQEYVSVESLHTSQSSLP